MLAALISAPPAVVYFLVVLTGRLMWTTAGAVAAGYAALWFGAVHGWEWMAASDDGTLRATHGFGAHRPDWIAFWNTVSTLLGPTALRVLAAIGIVLAWWKRRRRIAAFLTVSVMGMGIVTAVAKGFVDRPRPGTALTAAASSSFPSGHALGIMVGVLAFLTVLLPLLPSPARPWAVILGVAAVLLVGVARVMLNVHHPSDVLAGWALGYLWFLVCVTVVPPGLPCRAPAPR